MRSFMIGTLLVATVWANEEPTSRCEAWGYESENELECYGNIREMVDNPSHACWAELSEKETCCGYCGPWTASADGTEWVDTCRNLDIIRVTPGCGYEIEAYGQRYTYDRDKNFCYERGIGCDAIQRIRVFATSAAGGKQHAAKTGPVEGRWEVYRNIDMAYQGDVEIIGDWKRHTSIDKLKKIVEEKGYSAVCVGSFGHAALKSFDYQLTKEHCKPSEGYTNEIHIWFPSGEAAKPLKVEVPDCTLVMAHAAECVKLLPEVAQALRAGRTTPLLLASHPGYAIVPKSDEPQRIDDWGVNYQQLGIGPASEALQAKMHGEFLLSQHPATRDYVLDVPFATYAVHCEGEHGKLPLAVISWDDRSRNLDADAPRTFVVNADNSISPTKATHLAFGIRGVLPAVVAEARVGVTSTVPQTYAHADRTITHRKPGPRLTYADSEAYAAKMGGRLLTLEEAIAFMGGRPLYPGEDQWCAVQGRDWVQVGDSPHRPGTSHLRDFSFYPPWGDDANDQSYGNPSWNYVALYKAGGLGTPVQADPSGSAPPLAEMVARFKRELKLKEAMTMADAVGEACTALGVKREGSLIEQAQKCWAVLCG